VYKDNDTWVCKECDPFCAVCDKTECVECKKDYFANAYGKCIEKEESPFEYTVSIIPL